MTSSFSEKLTKVKNALEHVFVKKTDIKNNLTSTDTDKPLSANQGKVLNDGKVDKVSGKGLSKNDFTDTYKGKLDDLDSNLSNKANSTHTHGNLQNDGSVGTSNNVNKNVITDGNGKITTEDKYTHPTGIGTALTTSSLKKIKYDAQGHITGTANVNSSDLPSHNHTTLSGVTSITSTMNGQIRNLFSQVNSTQWALLDGKISYTHNDSIKYNNYELATLNDIPSLTNYIQQSQTSGLIKNDGTIDTTTYSTFDGNYNSLTNKPNIPTITNVTPTAETDIDTYKIAGLYTFFNNTAVASMTLENKEKLPDGLGNNSFYLLVENKNDYAKQTLTQYSTGTTWIRIYNDNNNVKSWTSWTELSIEGHTHDDRYYTETEVDTALNGKSISIEKQSTADTGYTATYVLKQGGTDLSPKINIPKDYLVKSGTLETVGSTPTTLESTNSLTTGDKYLKFIVNTQENDDSTILIIPVTDLIDTYTGDNSTIELNNGVFSVKSNVFANKTHTHSQYLTSHQDISSKANISDLATVATTGDYDDLIDKPNIPKVFYGTCSTTASTNPKEVTTSTDFILETGIILMVKFTYTQTYVATTSAPLQLKINNNNPVNVALYGSNYNLERQWVNGEVVHFIYDGSVFRILNRSIASTTYYGLTRLDNSINSTSTDMAATPSAVKQAYDLADTKLDKVHIGQKNKNVVVNSNGNIDFENKPTIPSASSTTPSADVSGGVIGSSSTFAKADHQHPLSGAYATASHTHGISDISPIISGLNVNVWENDRDFVYLLNSKIAFDPVEDVVYYNGITPFNEIATKSDIEDAIGDAIGDALGDAIIYINQ